MRDGIYSFRYEAYGRLSRGSFTLKGDIANGGDTRVLLEGRVSNTVDHVIAALDVTSVAPLDPPHPRDGMVDFAVRLTGHGSETHFDVIGVGPRGLIVSLAGEWTAPLSPHASDR